MDNNPYLNILNAMNAVQPAPQRALTTQQQADNYSAFSDLMAKGVYLPDLVKRVEELEARVGKNASNSADEELFAVMEASVRDDPAVKDALRLVQAEKTRVISALCMQDVRYREAWENHRRAVNAAYVRKKEETRPAD